MIRIRNRLRNLIIATAAAVGLVTTACITVKMPEVSALPTPAPLPTPKPQPGIPGTPQESPEQTDAEFWLIVGSGASVALAGVRHWWLRRRRRLAIEAAKALSGEPP